MAFNVLHPNTNLAKSQVVFLVITYTQTMYVVTGPFFTRKGINM